MGCECEVSVQYTNSDSKIENQTTEADARKKDTGGGTEKNLELSDPGGHLGVPGQAQIDPTRENQQDKSGRAAPSPTIRGSKKNLLYPQTGNLDYHASPHEVLAHGWGPVSPQILEGRVR